MKARTFWLFYFSVLIVGIVVAVVIAWQDNNSQTPPKQVQGIYEATKWTDGKDEVLIITIEKDSVEYYRLSEDEVELFGKESMMQFKKIYRQVE